MLEYRSASRHTSAIILGLTGVCLGWISTSAVKYSDEALNLQKTLSAFASRGQMSIELLPPFATLLPIQIFEPELRAAVVLFRLLLAVLFSKSIRPKELSTWILWIGFSLAMVLNWGIESDASILALGHDLGDRALMVAILTMTGHGNGDSLSWMLFLGLGEMLVFMAFACGSSCVEVYTVYALLVAKRLYTAVKKISNQKISLTYIFGECIGGLAISLLIWPTIFLIVCGSILPVSERTTGGNYNLRYLSPEARRSITPFGSVLDMPSRAGSSRPFGIIDSVEMYTLYVPRAGFLWSDPMLWAEDMSKSERGGPGGGEDWSIDSSQRVLFQDKFAERYPWVFQGQELQRSTKKRRQVIRSGSDVRMLSPTSDSFLCVIPEERVVSEPPRHVQEELKKKEGDGEASMVKFRVGTLEEPSSNCDWRLYYDPFGDEGLTIYNQEHNCRLATTFRSVPDPDLDNSNDTIKQTLGLKLEASCTVGANEESSRFHLIDGTIAGRPNDKQRAIATTRSVGPFRRGWWYFQARYELAQFRKHHAKLQSVNVPRLNDWMEAEGIDSAYVLCCGLLGIFVVGCLIRQRTCQASRVSRTISASLPVFQTAFVLTHMVAGDHSSKLPSLVSLHGMVQSILLAIEAWKLSAEKDNG